MHPDQTVPVRYEEDPIVYEQVLRAKLQPPNLRATMAFAGLYQITSEMIKHVVVEKVEDFYRIDIEPNGEMSADDKNQYENRVLSLAPKRFPASLRWLVDSNAISAVQAERLSMVQAHRNELTHELVRFMVDPDATPSVDLLIEALSILRDLHRFWIEVELSAGGLLLPDGTDVSDVDPAEVVPASLVLLQQCIDAYVEDFTTEDAENT